MTTDAGRSLALSAILVLSLLALTTPAAAVERSGTVASTTSTQTISDCTVIDSPGSYALSNNITSNGSCIEITASDVHLDGQGYTLESTDHSTENIAIHINGADGGLSNVTVRNVVFVDWNWDEFESYGRAVLAERVTDATVTDLQVNDTDRAIEFQTTTESTVRNNQLRWAGDAEAAIYLSENSDRNAIVDNNITEPGEQYTYGGIRLDSSANNTVRNNTIEGSGIQLRDGSDHNNVTSNRLYPDNLSPGIRAGFSSNNSFLDNEVYGPGDIGITLDHAGDDNLVADNVVNGTGSDGISIYRVDDTVVRDNVVRGNEGDGIVVEVGSNNTVRDNTIGDRDGLIDNNGWGVTFGNVANSTIANNTVYISGGSGLRLTDTFGTDTASVDITVRNNSINYLPLDRLAQFDSDSDYDGVFEESGALVASGTHGVQLANANDNTLTENTIRNGYRGFEVTAGADNNTLRDNAVYELNNETEFAIRIRNSTGTTVETLDIGNATAENTTVSLTGENVTLNPNDTAVANPDAVAIGRYVEATNVSAASTLTLTMHYEYEDVANIDQSTFALWRYDGEEWHELDNTTLDTANQTGTVAINGSTLDSSTTYGAFGQQGTWPTPTPTVTPPATETGQSGGTTSTAQTAPTADTAGTTTTGGSGPGFGVLAGLVAFALAALLLGRRG